MHFTRTQTFITNVKSHHSLCERTDAVVQRWGNMSGVGVQSKQPGASSSSVCAGEQRPEPHDTEQKHESPFQCLHHLYTIKQHDLNYSMLYTEKKSRQKRANVWMKTIAAYDQLQWFNSKLYTHTRGENQKGSFHQLYRRDKTNILPVWADLSWRISIVYNKTLYTNGWQYFCQ